MIRSIGVFSVVFLLAGMVNAQVILEEVVVTAQKREQNLQDVGIAVTAFSGEQLRTLGFTNAQELSALAPGVSTIQPNGPSNYALAIRGVAQNDFISNQESPVSIYVDETYISQMSGAGFLLFDMERVEILRGPQGTLFGRNATGGLAHFVTRKPTQELDGYGQVTVGSYNQVKFQGAVGGGLNDALAARLSVATHHNDGYIENRVLDDDINNANDYAARLQLLFTPSDDVSLLFNARGALQQIRTGGPFENVSSRDTDGDGLGELTPQLTNINGYRDDDGDVFAGDYDKFGHQDMESYGLSGTLKWQVSDDKAVTYIIDYQSIERDYTEDSDASPFADFNFFLNTNAEQFSQELRLSGETDALRWVAGFYYLNIEVKDANGAEQPLSGPGVAMALTGQPNPLIDSPNSILGAQQGNGSFQGVDNPYTTDTSSWSVFGQAEYDLTEQLTAIVGFRWIEESKEHSYASNFVDFEPGTRWRNGNPNIIAPFGNYDGELDRGLWSARAELDWRPTDDLLIYASWNRGVKGGGFNAPLDVTDPDPAAMGGPLELNDALMRFDEEKLYAFETGFKSTLAGGRARLNASAFYYDYQDFQAFRIVGLSTFIFNADAESYGFEVELQAAPVEGMDLLLGLGYVDIDLPVDLQIGLGVRDTKPVQSPKWNLNGLARYEWPAFAFGGTLAVQGDFHYRSEHFFSLTQAEAVTENGYAVVNARISYATADQKWEAAIFANNLFDEEYLVQTFDLATVLGMTEQYYGLPRWIGGSIAYNF